eukprot:COSAG01_NODE_4916_length_4629_cov_1.893157_3_plen_146_part_00
MLLPTTWDPPMNSHYPSEDGRLGIWGGRRLAAAGVRPATRPTGCWHPRPREPRLATLLTTREPSSAQVTMIRGGTGAVATLGLLLLLCAASRCVTALDPRFSANITLYHEYQPKYESLGLGKVTAWLCYPGCGCGFGPGLSAGGG